MLGMGQETWPPKKKGGGEGRKKKKESKSLWLLNSMDVEI